MRESFLFRCLWWIRKRLRDPGNEVVLTVVTEKFKLFGTVP